MPGGEPLRLLILEDRADDAELAVAELVRAGFAPEWERVDTAAAFVDGLAAAPDLVLADYNLPQFDGARALSIVLSQAPDTPLILLSGEVSTALAVECMQRGAADYLPKREMERLGPAVRRALERQRLRREARHASERLGQLNRMLYAVRSVHRAMARERDIPALLRATCRILEVTEGFGGAWIGRHSTDGLVAVAGDVELAARMARTADGGVDLWGGYPTNRACAARKPVLCGDLAADLAGAETLAAVGERAFPAAAAVPIVHDEDLLGALTVFGTRRDVLESETLTLLGDLGSDLGRAIRAIETEDELKRREYWLQQAQRVGRAGYYSLDIAAGTWTSSEELDRVLGIDSPFSRTVAAWAGLIHAEDREGSMCYLREDVIGRRGHFDREYRIVRPSDGATRWVWGRGELALDPAGNAVRMFGTIQDVTERHDAEEALRESERKYRSMVEGLPVGVYRSTTDGRILAANRAWLDLMGYDSAEQVTSLRMARDIYVDATQRPRLVDRVSAASGATVFETQWKRRDGTPIDVCVTTRPVRGPEGTTVGFESAVEDVTRRRALEEQLREAQKIEAVGQLAGGVAHDFNNLLTTIVTSVDLLSDLAPAGSEAAEDLSAIKHAAERGADLTRKLLAFGRKQRLELRTMDLNVLVRDFTKLAKRLVREDVEIVALVEPVSLPVLVDPTAVDQILMNLTTNARDAMPGGGVLGIQTGRMTLDEEFCASHGWGKPGEFAVLSVSDTGKGMDAPTLRHLFEPFFTTKPVGEGTGLGTSMVHGLVIEHGGHINVESAPGQGTAVKILFPLADRGEQAPAPSEALESVGGTEALLLVDDEETLRTSAKRMLERHGYRVHLASDGADALGVYLAREGEIALIVTDVVMPRMSGPDLRAELRRRGKAPRILFTSGYTARDAMQARHLGEGTRFIAKPWTARGLLRAVREALDAEPTP